ncbi:MAG: hypothetical protein HQL53_01415 [Magnetococcales bacterium]|nr:hypothetical protein [Magnetococcales bacterium]
MADDKKPAEGEDEESQDLSAAERAAEDEERLKTISWKQKGCVLVFPIAAIISTMVESGLFGLYVGGAIGRMVAMGVHASLALLLLIVTLLMRKTLCSWGWCAFLTISTTFLGPGGPIGALFTFWLDMRYRRYTRPAEEWFSALFPEEETGDAEILAEKLDMDAQEGRSGSVMPFADVLKYGEQSQKQAMIAMALKQFQPRYAPVLKQALLDQDNAVRVQAATAITHLENRFLERTMKLEEEQKLRPNDPEFLLELARHYDDYAFTGILDDVRERENRDQAIQVYRHYLELKPGDTRVQLAVGRNLMRRDLVQEAADFLEPLATHEGAVTQMRMWYMESLFLLGRHNDLEEAARGYLAHVREIGEDGNMQVIETVQFWAGELSVDQVVADGEPASA